MMGAHNSVFQPVSPAECGLYLKLVVYDVPQPGSLTSKVINSKYLVPFVRGTKIMLFLGLCVCVFASKSIQQTTTGPFLDFLSIYDAAKNLITCLIDIAGCVLD